MTSTTAASVTDGRTGQTSIEMDLLPYLSSLHYRSPESSFRSHRRTRGWLEKSSSWGEEWLRGAASKGDCFAMLKLGERLLEGDGLKYCAEEGLFWLRKSAANEYLPAMESLGTRLLDSDEAWASAGEGEGLHRRAASLGRVTSIFNLGHRLLVGDRMPLDPEAGIILIRRAAQRGDRLAMTVLGTRALIQSGVGDEEGRYWMTCAGAPEPKKIPRLGRYAYSRACLAVSLRERKRISKEAADLFAVGIRDSPRDAFGALNLAYLLRRDEIPEVFLPVL